jgi:glutamine synthetase type III
MPGTRRLAAVLVTGVLAATGAACGEDDVQREADQTRQDIEREAGELEGNLDDLSEQDLREALKDAEEKAESGGKDAKREARELERKIERELDERNK